MRRCNLSCAYCNEYDDHSKPVPLETMCQRLDRLAELGTDHRHHQRRRAAAASRPGPDHRAHSPPRHDRRHDHQRLPAHRRAHPAAEPRRARAPADLHRQRDARRRFEEEPQGARQEAATAGRARRISTSTSTRWWAAAFAIRRTRWSIGRRALELGFTSTVGIIHDGDGQLQPLARRGARSLHWPCAPWKRAATRRSTISRTTSRTARRTTGAAAPARATSTSAKTAWCTTARSSAAIPPSR